MLRTVKVAIAVNLALGLLFLYSSFAIWGFVNSEYPYLNVSHWSPFLVVASHYSVNANRTFDIAQGIFLTWNFPFWLFWSLLIANLYLMLRLSREVSQKLGQMNNS
jgi:hypothetical protein